MNELKCNIFSDQRRMKEIRMYLAKLRMNPDKVDKPKKEVRQTDKAVTEAVIKCLNSHNVS